MAQAAAAALGGLAGGASGLAAGIHVEANNRELHESESEKLSALKKGKTPEEQQRLNAAACALVRCADGVPQSDPYYSLLKGLQDKGATYQDEMTTLLKTGEFIYKPYLDPLRDAITRNGELKQRLGGAADLGLGTLGLVAGGTLAVSGALGCGPSAGTSCALVPVGVYVAKASSDQAQQGGQSVFGTYVSAEGKRVLDSFDIATYPGERDPLAEIGIDATKLGLTYLLGKYIPAGLAKAEEKIIEKGSASTLKDGKIQYPSGMSFNKSIPDHISKVDGFSQKSGISGGHNADEFYQAVKSYDIKIVSKSNGSANGISNVDYQIPARDPAGNVLLDANGAVLYKREVLTKTIYDPRVISDSEILRLGQEAASRGYADAISNSQRGFDAKAGGILFRVYIDLKTGLVTNFHPQ